MGNQTTVVIDGDIIAFQSSASIEKRWVVAEKDGHTITANSKRDLENSGEFGKVDLEGYTITKHKSVGELNDAKMVAHSKIKAIKKACEADKCIIVVQGEGNFRDSLPLPKKYKGNREGVERPEYLMAMKDWLVERHKALRSKDNEADDVLSIYAYKGWKEGKRIIQATFDKDANQCKGWLYNWNKMDTPTFMDDTVGTLSREGVGTGLKWLFYQVLVGDDSDNYKPSYLAGKKFGTVGAFDVLGECKTFKSVIQATTAMYKEWYPYPFNYTTWDGKEIVEATWKDMFQLYMDCAHMQRWENDRVDVRRLLEKAGVA